MKTTSFLAVWVVAMSFGASARADFSMVAPSNFVGTWTEATRYSTSEVITINADGSYTSDNVRQVGEAGTAVPNPTVCNFRKTGKITAFNNATQEFT